MHAATLMDLGKSEELAFSAGSTHVVAVVVGGLFGPSDCFGLPWLSHQD